LLLRRNQTVIAKEVAPGNRRLGVMLPYTPLHYLLMDEFEGPIVLTSGNMSDEPIAYLDEKASVQIGAIADAWLVHDRKIHVRCDDSVVRVTPRGAYPLRRSRGFAPEPVIVHPFAKPVMAAGGELKHTFCFGVGERAILSHHIGDLENWEAMSALLEGVEHFARLFDVQPQIVAHDLHPEYLSTKWAKSLDVATKVVVQHHHAHIASCLADNGRDERVIGLALDGTGYGDDDTLWGCEVLDCEMASYRRRAHLRYVPLPGGSAAIKEPWRMAAIYLHQAFGPAAAELNIDFVRATRGRWEPLLAMVSSGINSPPASSAGRLFDAVAALCGVRETVSYEGQAAAELEQLADPSVSVAYPCPVGEGEIDGVQLVAAAAEDLAGGSPAPHVAGAFHNGLAEALVRCCEEVRRESGVEVVALSGGTFQNALLLERVVTGLDRRGFDVLVHRRVPPNDGGLALGQAVVANARLR
jgi:hydrogenase maturation protein HypF